MDDTFWEYQGNIEGRNPRFSWVSFKKTISYGSYTGSNQKDMKKSKKNNLKLNSQHRQTIHKSELNIPNVSRIIMKLYIYTFYIIESKI